MNRPIYLVVNKNKIILTAPWVTPYGTIPKGFISDGVSVPWIFRWFIHKRGSLLFAAIFHDWAYQTSYKTKAYADNSFYKIAIHTKANVFKAKIAYLAVKHFGKGNY